MSAPVVYLAGPMTGYHQWNFPAFFAAAAMLERRFFVRVINPAQRDLDNGFDPDAPPEGFTLAQRYEAMRWDLKQVLSRSVDAVIYLPESMHSNGARLEMDVAEAVGKPVIPLGLAHTYLRPRGAAA